MFQRGYRKQFLLQALETDHGPWVSQHLAKTDDWYKQVWNTQAKLELYQAHYVLA